jgi:protein disulfide-isomerase
MIIDIWSDVVCPFCYLGSAQLSQALTSFPHADHVQVRTHAFELDPTAIHNPDISLDKMLANKYQMTVEKAQSLHHDLEGKAAELGMHWSLAIAKVSNTFDAHRLIALAGTQQLEAVMVERLFQAYFSEGKLISDRDVLNELASEVGVTGVDQLWEGDLFVDDVRHDEATAHSYGITGVPAMVFDGKYLVVGAQGVAGYTQALEQTWAERTN